MWWDSPIPDVERLGFLCDSSDSVVEGSKILWQEHLQRWSNTDTVVEGPGFCGRSTLSGGVERFQSEITRLRMWNLPI